MAIRISSNTDALRAQRQVSLATGKLRSVYEQLSTGMRINQASDDAAGLAISSSLRNQVRLATTAIRNANDGISFVNIGNSALGEITNVLMRMAELAEQSANGTFANRQRSALQLEFAALGSEIQRIAVTTTFNGINILSGSANVILQVGYNSASTAQLAVRAVQGTLEGIGLASAGAAMMNYQIISDSDSNSQVAARTALAAVMAAIDAVGVSRGSLGADENRLSSSVSNLQSARENFEAADSRIRDVDVAEATSDLVRLQILQNSGLAILAQASQQPEIALRLLKP